MNSNLIIVVNDNGMSIAENHGGIYRNLELLRQTGGKAECNLFRAMGLDYVFQPEGNHTDALIETFQQVKDCDHPVVVHIVTEKGKGYAPAETHKENWHWCMPFDPKTGESTVHFEGEDYGDLTARYLLKEMQRTPKWWPSPPAPPRYSALPRICVSRQANNSWMWALPRRPP